MSHLCGLLEIVTQPLITRDQKNNLTTDTGGGELEIDVNLELSLRNSCLFNPHSFLLGTGGPLVRK